MTTPASAPVFNPGYPFGMAPPETGATEEFGRPATGVIPAIPTVSTPAITVAAPVTTPSPPAPAAPPAPYLMTEVVAPPASPAPPQPIPSTPAPYDTHLTTSTTIPMQVINTPAAKPAGFRVSSLILGGLFLISLILIGLVVIVVMTNQNPQLPLGMMVKEYAPYLFMKPFNLLLPISAVFMGLLFLVIGALTSHHSAEEK